MSVAMRPHETAMKEIQYRGVNLLMTRFDGTVQTVQVYNHVCNVVSASHSPGSERERPRARAREREQERLR